MEKPLIHNRKKILIGGLLLGMFLLFIFVLVYKAQIRWKNTAQVKCTLASLHKPSGFLHLSSDTPEASQTFLCMVPELKKLRIRCTAVNINPSATLDATLKDAENDQIYYHSQRAVREILQEDIQSYIVIQAGELSEKSENRLLTLSLKLIDGKDTDIEIMSNTKPGIVTQFNQNSDDKTNILYDIIYSNAGELNKLYIILCVPLFLFGFLSYYLLFVKRFSMEKAFFPLALVLGIIFNFVFMVHGVPDEPDHINTAYYYSNQILSIPDTGTYSTIYKRLCDVQMQDMLVNGLENNSYYLLMHHFFEKPDNTELVEVPYINTSTLVPAPAYIPAAIGISLGRILGLSTLLTITLGRIANLMVYLILSWFSIRIIPFGKNVLGVILLLPVSMQQAASSSYDSMLINVITLFISLCFYLKENKKHRKRYYVLMIALIFFIVMSKGGVYIPVLLLLFLILYNRFRGKHLKLNKSIVVKSVIVCLCFVGILFAVFYTKFAPLFETFFSVSTGGIPQNEGTLYNIPTLIEHPLQIIYLYWNTFISMGDTLLSGLIGGRLSWVNVNINWIYIIVLLSILLLLVNTEGDQYNGNRIEKLIIALACLFSVLLIMMSMLLAYTPATYDYIAGLQGRYFLVLLLPALFLTANHMIHITKEQCSKILLVTMLTEIMILLNAVVKVL